MKRIPKTACSLLIAVCMLLILLPNVFAEEFLPISFDHEQQQMLTLESENGPINSLPEKDKKHTDSGSVEESSDAEQKADFELDLGTEQKTIALGSSLRGTPDNTPPELESITIDKTEVEAPGTITVTAKATDDISGVKDFYMRFVNTENSNFYYDVNIRANETGKFAETVEISQYARPGNYRLEYVDIYDVERNKKTYYSRNTELKPEDMTMLPQEVSFVVRNGDGTVFITNTQNPDLVEDIKNQPDGQTIAVNYGTGSKISEEIFDAIKGTDKTLIFEDGGVQWEFHGQDVQNSKSLDLKVNVEEIQFSKSGNVDDIESIVQDTPTVVMSFANNGKLPGKATIRIKADYAFRKYMGTKELHVYYYDNTAKKLVLVAQTVSLTEDNYLTFEIDHNSDFIVTKGAVRLSNSGGDGGGDHSGGGDSDGSGGGGRVLTSAAVSNTINSASAVAKSRTAIKNAIALAQKTQQATATAVVSIQKGSKLTSQTLTAIQNAIKTEQRGKPVAVTTKLSIENLTTGKLNYAVAFDPLKVAAASTLEFEITLSEKTLQTLFAKYFSNSIQVITFKQKSAFGVPVDVTVKLDSTKVDRSKPLFLYSYERTTNQYSLMEQSNATVGTDGYLHFTTTKGNSVLITNMPMIRK